MCVSEGGRARSVSKGDDICVSEGDDMCVSEGDNAECEQGARSKE
jgi:hypothetical protein